MSSGLANAGPRAHPGKQSWADVPWRTIVATIGIVLGSALALAVIYRASRVLVWVLVAGFFALVLARPVGWLQQRFHVRRGVAVGLVVLLATAFVGGLMALFVFPLRRQLVTIVTDLPGTVRQAAAGEGQCLAHSFSRCGWHSPTSFLSLVQRWALSPQ